MYKNVQECTRMRKNVQECTRMYKNVQELKKAERDARLKVGKK